MTSAEFREGAILEIVTHPEWGPGKVVHINGDKVHVIFRDLEEEMARQFQASAPALRRAQNQTDEILENLPPLVEKNGRWYLPAKRYTLHSLKRTFTHYFPTGFADPKYHANERTYKMDAHIKFNQMLGVEQMRTLLKAGNVLELAVKAISIEARLNLLSVFEKAAFRGGLKAEDKAGDYFNALLHVLDEQRLEEGTFNKYLDALFALPVEGHKVASWPVATLFLYLADPFKNMFLKPQVTKNAADSLGFDLKYDASPNWRTYDALIRMGNTYLELLRPLGACDFIDVQSFIYVSCGGYEAAIAKKQQKALRPRADEGETTVPGFENSNGQVVVRRTENRGTDHEQWIYELRCTKCGGHYGANGSDIWQRKCPKCGEGAPGLPLLRTQDSMK